MVVVGCAEEKRVTFSDQGAMIVNDVELGSEGCAVIPDRHAAVSGSEGEAKSPDAAPKINNIAVVGNKEGAISCDDDVKIAKAVIGGGDYALYCDKNAQIAMAVAICGGGHAESPDEHIIIFKGAIGEEEGTVSPAEVSYISGASVGGGGRGGNVVPFEDYAIVLGGEGDAVFPEVDVKIAAAALDRGKGGEVLPIDDLAFPEEGMMTNVEAVPGDKGSTISPDEDIKIGIEVVSKCKVGVIAPDDDADIGKMVFLGGTEGAVLPDEDAKMGKNPTLPDAAVRKARKPKLRRAKQPPPFIGPKRPISFDDLEDINNGVYDLKFPSGGEEDDCPYSSSNETCTDSSDPDAWLEYSSSDSDFSDYGSDCPRDNATTIARRAAMAAAANGARASLDQIGKQFERLSVENKMVTLDERVRRNVCARDPQLSSGLQALGALNRAAIHPVSLVKYTHLVETAARLCGYVPPPRTHRLPRNNHLRMDDLAKKVRVEAEAILGRMMVGLFLLCVTINLNKLA